MGSASLATQLIEHDLVDEYRLMIEPILLGGGKRIFPDDGRARSSWSRSRQPRPASCSAPTGKRATGPAPLARPASAAAPRRSVVNTTEGSNPTPTRHAGLNPGDGTRRRSACGRTPPKFDRVIGALKHNPYEWTLVVPCVLTTTERSFIEGLGAGYQVKISVIDKAELDGRIAMFPDLEASFTRNELVDLVLDDLLTTIYCDPPDIVGLSATLRQLNPRPSAAPPTAGPHHPDTPNTA